MDFMNRGGRPVQQNTQTQTHGPEHTPGPVKSPVQKSSKLKDKAKLARIAYVGFLGAITILVVAVLLSFAFAKDISSKEKSYVNKDQFQAVFLNGGQVYFGKITDLNERYLSMGNIYYLRVNQQVQPDQQQTSAAANDISLVKLGCELHGPQDSMVINREQIIFWENLKTDGQVAKAVAEYVKANPNGQNCDQQNNSNTKTNSTTPTTTVPGTTTPSTTKPGTTTTGR
jgi:hypothetical protein